jgi:7-keto-8-aminopelargonate synthetase-like enzyme
MWFFYNRGFLTIFQVKMTLSSAQPLFFFDKKNQFSNVLAIQAKKEVKTKSRIGSEDLTWNLSQNDKPPFSVFSEGLFYGFELKNSYFNIEA